MKLKKITYKEAKKLAEKLGLCFGGESDGRTFYATDEDETELWEYDTKEQRDREIG